MTLLTTKYLTLNLKKFIKLKCFLSKQMNKEFISTNFYPRFENIRAISFEH